MGSPPAPLNEYVQGYPAKLEGIIQRALAKHREERYQSASEFAFDLTEVEGQLKRELLDANFAKAEAFLVAGEYEPARQELGRVLEFDPQNAHAHELMRKVQRATARRQRKGRAQSLQVHAEEAVKLNRLAEALSYVDQALRLDPANAGLNAYRVHITGLQAHTKKLDQMLARAERACAVEDFDEAGRAVEEALQFDPNSSRARSFQAILQSKRNQGFASLADGRVAPSRADIREDTAEITGINDWPSSKNASSGRDPIWSDDAANAASSILESRAPEGGFEGRFSNAPPAGHKFSPSFFEAGGSDAATAPLPVSVAGIQNEASGAVSSNKRQPPLQAEGKETPQSFTWKPELLRAAEEKLAVFLGPMAKLMVRKAASQARDENELYALLAQSLDEPQQRTAFLAAFSPERKSNGALSQPIAESSHASTVDRGALLPASLEQASQLLASYVGPLAGVLTKKAARRAHSLRALYLILSEHIANEEDRERFLRDAGFRVP